MEDNITESFTFDAKNELAQLDARFLTVVELLTPGRGGLRALSKMSGITYARWRNALAGRSAPSIDMIICLSKMKPEWLEWMLTGKTSVTQTAPSEQDLKRAEYLQKINRPVPGMIQDPDEGQKPSQSKSPLDFWDTEPKTSQPTKGETDTIQPDQSNPNW
jgi:hypothetical protein